MNIRKKIIKIGGSRGVIIDKVILDSMNLDIGDTIEIDIIKIRNHSLEDGGDTHHKKL